MFSWNHRIVRIDEDTLAFKEVHYSDTGVPEGYTDIFTCGDDVAELATLADRLKAACALPVLSAADFVDANKKDESPEARRAAIIADLISISNPYPKAD